MGIEVKIQVGFSLRRWHPTPSELAGTGLDRFAAFPEKGADHHGIFQPLAAVHGHHGDGLFGCIAAAQMGLRTFAVVLETLAPQPVGCMECPEPQLVHLFLNQFSDLLQVRQRSSS